jgi:uncharacterized protein (TIGR02246 family)
MRAVAAALLAVLCCAALAMAAAPTHSAHAPDKLRARHAIQDANDAWAQAQIHADAAALVALFMDDGMEFSTRSGKSIQGRDSLLAFWTRSFKQEHPTEATVTTVEVALNGDYATEVGNYHYLYPPDSAGKAPQPIDGRYAVVWRVQKNGEWKIYVDMGIPK